MYALHTLLLLSSKHTQKERNPKGVNNSNATGVAKQGCFTVGTPKQGSMYKSSNI